MSTKPNNHNPISLTQKLSLQGIFIEGNQMLDEFPRDYYILIAKDLLTFAYPVLQNIAAIINPSGECWIENTLLKCDWSSKYRPIEYKIST
jgi:hypothetical protein